MKIFVALDTETNILPIEYKEKNMSNDLKKEINRIAEFINTITPLDSDILSIDMSQSCNTRGCIHLSNRAFVDIFDSWRIVDFDRKYDKLTTTIGNVEIIALAAKKPVAPKETYFVKSKW